MPESCSEPLAEANESQVLRLPCMAEGTPKILTRVFCPAWRALARAQASEGTCEESEFPALPHASDLPSPAPRCHPTLGPRDRSPPSKEPWDLRSVSWLCHSLTFHVKGSPVNWAPGTGARHSWGPRLLHGQHRPWSWPEACGWVPFKDVMSQPAMCLLGSRCDGRTMGMVSHWPVAVRAGARLPLCGCSTLPVLVCCAQRFLWCFGLPDLVVSGAQCLGVTSIIPGLNSERQITSGPSSTRPSVMDPAERL